LDQCQVNSHPTIVTFLKHPKNLDFILQTVEISSEYFCITNPGSLGYTNMKDIHTFAMAKKKPVGRKLLGILTLYHSTVLFYLMAIFDNFFFRYSK